MRAAAPDAAIRAVDSRAVTICVQVKICDAGLKLFRLRGEFFRGRRHLLGCAGVLLRYLIELLDRLVHLLGADVLLPARRTDFGDQVVFLMWGTSLSNMSLASRAASIVCEETVPISVAAVWLRSASLRTSEATTAKPLPCSPARAASTAAFSASKSV